MRSRTASRGLVAAAAVVGAFVAIAPAGPVAAQADDPERELAERYAPVVWVRQQDGPCDRHGEPFEPTSVDIVLDNPEVFLRQVGNDDPVAVRGPSAADIFDLREGWYLDFPGDALDPGCVFEQDFGRFAEGRPSVVYAHIATQADRPGLLALQYWFFWYHNPAKNDHEGDWEFIQLLFEATTPDDALDGDPISVGFAQHTGGERADWDDGKLEREGSRPVVYPAVGSHASYFGQALYLGRSGSEGFGCDNTDTPSRRLDPEVVLLPDEVTDPDDSLAWLMFQGRWGQRERGFFNGPTGPFAKDRWVNPVSWQEGLRESSVTIPGGDQAGDAVLTTFCRTVEVGSTILVGAVRSPVVAAAGVALLVAIAIAFAVATEWSATDHRRLRRPRRFGQLVRASWATMRERPYTFAAIGVISIPVSAITSLVQWLVLSIPPVDDFVGLIGDRSSLAVALTLAVGGLGNVITFAIVSMAVAVVLDGGAPMRLTDPAARMLVISLLAALARAAAVVVVLALSVVGLPWAVRQLGRYQVLPQVVAIEQRRGGPALRRCGEVVTGHWWWSFSVAILLQGLVGLAAITVPLMVLIVATSLPLWAYGLVGSLAYVVLGPFAAAAITYLYGSLVSDEARSSTVDAPEGALAERPRR